MNIYKFTGLVGLLMLLCSCASAPMQKSASSPGELLVPDQVKVQGVPALFGPWLSRLSEYQNTRPAGFIGWYPDGKSMLITTRFGNSNQLHRVDMPLGMRRQLTFYSEPVQDASVIPGDSGGSFFFLKDTSGNENAQIYHYHPYDDHKLITDSKSMNFGIVWSNSGKKFAYSSNRANGRDFRIYLSSLEEPEKAVSVNDSLEGHWQVLDWSPDDRSLLVEQYVSAEFTRLFIIETESGKKQEIVPGRNKGVLTAAHWDKSGDAIYMLTDYQSEFLYLVKLMFKTNSLELLAESKKWDVQELFRSRDRNFLAYVVNENGADKGYIYDVMNKRTWPVRAPGVGRLQQLQFNPVDSSVAYTFSSFQEPGNIYQYKWEKDSLIAWTDGELGGLDSKKFPQTELITYPTFDSFKGSPRILSAFLFRPSSEFKEPRPVLVLIHGGPEIQYKPSFHPFMLYLVNELGIAVLAPNVRGSTGYGKTFMNLDNGYLRENSVKDIGELLRWIKQRPDLNSEKVAVYGGSYGGYMVLSSMSHFPEKVSCGVDLVGISHFVTFLEKTSAYRRDLRRVEYGDEQDPKMRAFLDSISPLNRSRNIKDPLLVIHGAQDPRVPENEAVQIVDELKRNGQKVWFLSAADEGHGFKKKPNIDYMQAAVTKFLSECLELELR